ncbi:DNA cytosine methyltransferase [Ralstonia pseudosolanacearum]|uniref:DNA cytosine methyltransferase n=1 Tax=Ralstonia pseudosolanacearum TaxID=1310165 RepID=UPI00210D3A16|nr:DNA cytosine methyltransferase [Ralstonia pseudosolanacearum]MCQ4680182.1 DNA cytosine methyltransferase [Ralstonia pseudosolanacearum]
MGAYYNEIDPYAAAWLRNLIAAGHIAPGDVDERDIQDVRPEDLRGYKQHHFFAGVGAWSLALRRAGWADDRPVWTGSCPCQPFSQAGKGLAFADERHLWPAWYHLIRECRPAVVFGEQVASKGADAWIDLVQDDMEAVDYAVGAVPFPAAGVGAPHIRDRLYWVAHADGSRSRRYSRAVRRAKAEINREGSEDGSNPDGFELGRTNGRLAHSLPAGRTEGRPFAGNRSPSGLCVVGGMANADGGYACEERQQRSRQQRQQPQDGGIGLGLGHAERKRLALGQWLAGVPRETSGADPRQATERAGIHPVAGPGPTNGLWRDADWLLCRDGRWRPVEPGTFPLVDGAPARVGRLRAYGNAICASAAQAFIESVVEWL